MTWQDALQAILTSVGGIVTVGGGAAAVAYAVFRFLAKRWLDQKFNEQLENLKQEQRKELEHVRHEIQSTFSRISKIHEKEFEVLPEAWRRLHDAYGKAFRVSSAFKQFPDVACMNEKQLNDFITGCRLRDYQKEELRKAVDRNKYYQDAIFWIDLSEAQTAQATFHNYLVENRIFMTDELRKRFGEVDKALSEALTAQEIGKDAGSGELLRESSAKVWQLTETLNAVETEVQRRLRYAEA